MPRYKMIYTYCCSNIGDGLCRPCFNVVFQYVKPFHLCCVCVIMDYECIMVEWLIFVAMPYAIKEAGFGLGILLVLVVTAVTGGYLRYTAMPRNKIVHNNNIAACNIFQIYTIFVQYIHRLFMSLVNICKIITIKCTLIFWTHGSSIVVVWILEGRFLWSGDSKSLIRSWTEYLVLPCMQSCMTCWMSPAVLSSFIFFYCWTFLYYTCIVVGYCSNIVN